MTNRLDELKNEWHEATGEDPDDYLLSGDDWQVGLNADDATEAQRLEYLASLTLAGLLDVAREYADHDYQADPDPYAPTPAEILAAIVANVDGE